MINKIRNWFYENSVKDLPVDEGALLKAHELILLKKPMLMSTFLSFYEEMAKKCEFYFRADGLEIELGSGVGFFKTIRPSLITSDIRPCHKADLFLDAENMNLESETVRCIYAINVFHHLSNPNNFFLELIRVLKSGGGCILIEPHNGFMSQFIHKNLHKDEYYDSSADSWGSQHRSGPLSGANQAMSHIVFERDINKFNYLYGEKLEIVEKSYILNGLRYLLSGGLNFRQLAPTASIGSLILVEKLLRRVAKHWSLHQIIVIRKI